MAPGNSGSGATCVNTVDPSQLAQIQAITGIDTENLYGEAMCNTMQNGALISTFGALSESPNVIPPFADQPCPSDTTWLYCWGAACTQTAEDMERRGPNAVQCQSAEGHP